MIRDKSTQRGARRETVLNNSVIFMCCEAGHHLMEPSMAECPLPRLRAAWSLPLAFVYAMLCGCKTPISRPPTWSSLTLQFSMGSSHLLWALLTLSGSQHPSLPLESCSTPPLSASLFFPSTQPLRLPSFLQFTPLSPCSFSSSSPGHCCYGRGEGGRRGLVMNRGRDLPRCGSERQRDRRQKE